MKGHYETTLKEPSFGSRGGRRWAKKEWQSEVQFEQPDRWPRADKLSACLPSWLMSLSTETWRAAQKSVTICIRGKTSPLHRHVHTGVLPHAATCSHTHIYTHQPPKGSPKTQKKFLGIICQSWEVKGSDKIKLDIKDTEDVLCFYTVPAWCGCCGLQLW